MLPVTAQLVRRRLRKFHHSIRLYSSAFSPPHRPLNHPTYLIWSANSCRGNPIVSTGIAASFLLQPCSSAWNSTKLIYLKPIQTGFPSDSDSGFVISKLTSLSLRLGIPLSISNSVKNCSLPVAEFMGKNLGGRYSGMFHLSSFEENTVTGAPELFCSTMYAWKGILPDLTAEWENAPIENSALLQRVGDCLMGEMDLFEGDIDPRSERTNVLSLVETFGGVASPVPSGTLQLDLYRPFRLPGILIGDCHRLSNTIGAYDSLKRRGYDIAAVVLEDYGLAKEVPLPSYLSNKVPVFVLPPFPKDPSNDLIEWFVKSDGVFKALKETIISLESLQRISKTACLNIEYTYLHRFRRNQALSVTDITNTEGCEKQMEDTLLLGQRKGNKATKLGWARHLKLGEEVVIESKKASKTFQIGQTHHGRNVLDKVSVKSEEDKWALKLAKSIAGVNEFLKEKQTRELLFLGLVGGQWMVGVIDELQMSSDKRLVLTDTLTQVTNTLPSETQQRNGRFQLMLYKLLWDTIVKEVFPIEYFFEYFSLDRHHILLGNVRDNIAKTGISAQTLEEIVWDYQNTFKMLPIANDQLLLRYKLKKDQTIIEEIKFQHDPEWVMSKYRECMEFWRNERVADYTQERWKCRLCGFARFCSGSVQ